MGYSIAQEDLTDKWWLIGTFGLGYMATIPFKNIHPGLDDCTLIENTRNSLQNHQKHMRKHLSIELFAYYLPFFSLLSLSLSCFFCFTSSRSTLHLHAAINPSTFQSLYLKLNQRKNPWQSSKPQATANLCTLPSPPLKRRML